MKGKKHSRGFGFIAVIWIVAALAVVGGGVYYASTQSVEVSNEDANATTTISANASGQVSLNDLLGTNVMCTFTVNQNGMESKGAAYISGQNISVDSVTTQDGKLVVESHMIKIGTDAYVWSSMGAGAGQGAKIKVSANMEAETKEKLAVDWDQKMDYDCKDWNPEQSRFTIPTNITFTDLSAMFNSNTSVNTSGNASVEVNQCAACDMIPDANAKAQCKAAFACK